MRTYLRPLLLTLGYQSHFLLQRLRMLAMGRLFEQPIEQAKKETSHIPNTNLN